MAILFRILALLAGCAAARAESIVCRAGETVSRSGLNLQVSPGAAAALVVRGPCKVVLKSIRVHGNRKDHPQSLGLPRAEDRFADHFGGNGFLVVGAVELVVEEAFFEEIAGFAILASGVGRVRISNSHVRDSGSRNRSNRNNTTGGILLEDGTANFIVEGSRFERILGNAVWTHSRYKHPRNGPGEIRGNTFDTVGRDAIQVGHAFGVRVVQNRIRNVGFPVDAVDVEGGGMPVGVDTSGNVDGSDYLDNEIHEFNGKCFDLDGFHHGAIKGNLCVNSKGPESYPSGHFGVVMNNTNPDMQSVSIQIENNRFEGLKYGAIFVIGSGHVVRNNTLARLHTAHCSDDPLRHECTFLIDEPDILRSGIYLGRGAERPALTRGNRIEGNTITGWHMDKRCVGIAPGIRPGENQISGNRCRHEPN